MKRYIELEDVPPRLFAIGDIHGCLEEIELLLDYLKVGQGLSQRDVVLFIGDYIDRGPKSREVIDLLLQFRTEYPASIFLRGNHEDMLLAFLGFEGREGSAYLYNGGSELLASYGVPNQGGSEQVREALLQAIPATHGEFYRSLQNYVLVGNFVFAHAGLNPLRDLHSQIEADLFWIREEFIHNVHYFGRTVVFGHTPYEDILFHMPFKIGIDTGLVYGNKLSCIEVVQEKVFQIGRGDKKVKLSNFPKK